MSPCRAACVALVLAELDRLKEPPVDTISPLMCGWGLSRKLANAAYQFIRRRIAAELRAALEQE